MAARDGGRGPGGGGGGGRGGGGSETEQDDCFLESCSVCLEPYGVDRAPKILSCFHTFCLPCLTALAESAAATAAATTTASAGLAVVTEAGCGGKEELLGEEAAERKLAAEDRFDSSSAQHEDRGTKDNVEEGCAGNEGDGNESVKEEETEEEEASSRVAQSPKVFVCPTCRAPVTVPEGGVAVLQTNFYVVTKAGEAAKKKPMPCEMCQDEEAGKEAAYFCDKCQQRMCRTCRRLHDKVVNTKEHQVTALLILTTRKASRPRRDTPMSAVAKNCKVHQDRELCLYCQDCDVMICLVCKLTSHQPHLTEDVGAAALRSKGELPAVVKRAKEQVLVMKKLHSRLSRDVSKLDRQRREAGEEVQARYNTLLAWASRSRDELLEAIAAESETARAEVETEDATISTTAETLSGLASRASLVSTTTTTTNDDDSSASETLLLKNKLQTALALAAEEEKRKELRERFDERGGREQRRFLSVRSESSAVDLGTVRAFLGELSTVGSGNTALSGGGGRDRGAPFVSVRDEVQALAARVGAVESKHSQLDAKLEEAKPKTNTTVAFQAASSFGCPVPARRTAEFTDVCLNIGNAYDPYAGVFTVPVSGMYMFQVSLLARRSNCSDSDSSIGLCVDNATLATGLCGEEANRVNLSACVCVSKGQCVFVKNEDTDYPIRICHGFNIFVGSLTIPTK
ncbi:uncharacterized protein LOC143299789 isoform X2 [Babylonia areolata]|uniref:uncharacterized protein LOC143299789 isoform X2 n=1 Tax=Babylonia areolata TaxID=304850 RepID=UPI003FD33695